MKLDRWRFAIAALSLVMAYPASAQQQDSRSAISVSPLTITLSTTTDRYRVDASIPVVITLTNSSNTLVRLRVIVVSEGAYRSLGWKFFLTADGKSLPKTAFHTSIRGEYLPGDSGIDPDGSLRYFNIKPGMSDRTTIDIKQLFNITQPGLYLFSVEMPQNGDSKTSIKSRPLQLNVYQ